MSAGSLADVAASPPMAVTEDMTLLDLLLREQQSLTAVDRFARVAEEGGVPAQAKFYQRLLPARPPQSGEQYAFEVDLDCCSGCKACVVACHTLNGLDENEIWREVGLLHGGSAEQPMLQHVTTACHHCVEPACLHGCPVNAYDKDPITGIVRHLDDQCIGCQYCTLACPYEVPKYNPARGIVRKCDMCSQRLAVGEAPACVQACPHEAIRIRLVDIEAVVRDCATNQFLPSAPAPDYTLPTTNYKTKRPLPRNLVPGDFYSLHPEHGHPPLVAMLVLTQMSVGGFLLEFLLGQSRLFPAGLPTAAALVLAALAFGIGHAGLGAATLHLGRPLYAFRALLGLRRSWLSREILVFSVFIGLASGHFTDLVVKWLGWDVPIPFREWMLPGAVVSGLAGVLSSMMIYHSTRKPTWNAAYAAPKFLLTCTTTGCGLATFALAAALYFHARLAGGAEVSAEALPAWYAALQWLGTGWIVSSLCKLAWDALPLLALSQRAETHWKRSARLLAGDLKIPYFGRMLVGIVCGVLVPLQMLILTSPQASGAATALGLLWLAFGLGGTVFAELLERHWYFTSAASPRMPGGLRT